MLPRALLVVSVFLFAVQGCTCLFGLEGYVADDGGAAGGGAAGGGAAGGGTVIDAGRLADGGLIEPLYCGDVDGGCRRGDACCTGSSPSHWRYGVVCTAATDVFCTVDGAMNGNHVQCRFRDNCRWPLYCCAHFNDGGQYSSRALCEPSCDLAMCRPGFPDDCPGGTTCQLDPRIDTLYTCR